MVVPFVQRTPATATLSLMAIVLPFKRSLFGEVALTVACRIHIRLLGQSVPAPVAYHCGPPAFVVVFGDVHICPWVLAQIWSGKQVLVIAQLGYDVIKLAQQGAVLLNVRIVEFQARFGHQIGDMVDGDFGWGHGVANDTSIVNFAIFTLHGTPTLVFIGRFL